jgi:hypothetical protein
MNDLYRVAFTSLEAATAAHAQASQSLAEERARRMVMLETIRRHLGRFAQPDDDSLDVLLARVAELAAEGQARGAAPAADEPERGDGELGNAPKTVGLRMAKASDADLDATYAIANLLEALEKGWYPRRDYGDSDAPVSFNPDSREHLAYLHERLLEIARTGSIWRVVMGLETVLSPRNAIVDPDADYLTLHPRIVRALAKEAAHPARIDDAAAS